VYRGQAARGYRPAGRRRNGHGRNGNLRHLALARVRARPRRRGGAPFLRVGIVFITLGLFSVAAFLTVASIAAGFDFVDEMNASLPPVTDFETLDFAQPSVVYDRTGTIVLATFQSEQRRVVTYDQIPKVLLDATIAVEDRTFWDNPGYDPSAIVSAFLQSLTGQTDRGGASTITQQLVRARLLPADVVAPTADQFVRKIKEILQARNLTQAFPGVEGKQRIITAYLNQIYYGHNAYGVAAAAQVYFGITDLNQLTPAQAALLAGMPQAPDDYDLFKYAVRDAQGRLVVPTQVAPGESLPAPVIRRNFILAGLEAGYGHFIRLTPEQYQEAINEPIVLNDQPTQVQWKAPQFVWYMKAQLDQLLADRAPVESGGYKIITTLDMSAQTLAEKYVAAGTILTNEPHDQMEADIDSQGLQQDRSWIERLAGIDIHNGALVAMDARTGDILAYVGSAGYYRNDLASPKFDPQFDVAGSGYRQPGSAWKPILYSAGFDAGKITAGTLLPDVVTEFSRGWFPKDADNRERGPVLMRQALTYSLNIPTIRALDKIGVDTVAQLAQKMGLTFGRGPNQLTQAGLAGAIGTAETNMVQLTDAYAALANNGVEVGPRTILSITDSAGNPVPVTGQNAPRQVISQQTAWLMTDILKDSTDPSVNSIFGPSLEIVNGPPSATEPKGERRPAAAKTGTTDYLADLSVYGYLAPPPDPNAPELVASVWMGNSDHSPPNGGDPSIIAAYGPGRIWQSFMRDYTAQWPVYNFPSPPSGIVSATIDAWSGGTPGPWTRETKTEYFLDGTQPGGAHQVDPPGLLYSNMCGGWYVDLTKAEAGANQRWLDADANWMSRARHGINRRGPAGSYTAYLFGHHDWGGPIAPTSCTQTPPPTAQPPPAPTPVPEPTAQPAG
jgi:membrane peptidoglycan carboxypeptidase